MCCDAKNGTFGHLHTKLLQLFVANGLLSASKLCHPFKTIPGSPMYSLANQIALQYLRKMSMDLTVASATSESDSALDSDPSSDTPSEALELTLDGIWLEELIESRDPTGRRANFQNLTSRLHERINSLESGGAAPSAARQATRPASKPVAAPAVSWRSDRESSTPRRNVQNVTDDFASDSDLDSDRVASPRRAPPTSPAAQSDPDNDFDDMPISSAKPAGKPTPTSSPKPTPQSSPKPVPKVVPSPAPGEEDFDTRSGPGPRASVAAKPPPAKPAAKPPPAKPAAKVQPAKPADHGSDSSLGLSSSEGPKASHKTGARAPQPPKAVKPPISVKPQVPVKPSNSDDELDLNLSDS
jgi:hypothetical protein